MDALGRSPFGRLSKGVLSHIFSFMSTPQDLVRCQATCRGWKSSLAQARPQCLLIETFFLDSTQLVPLLAKHSNLIRHVREVPFTFDQGLYWEVWTAILLSATCLESLIVENLLPCWGKGYCGVYLEEAQLDILPRSLTSLCLRGVDADPDETWASMPSGLQLRTLALAASSLPFPLPACMASLTCLHLRLDDDPGDSGLDGVVLGCPMLQQLRLETFDGQLVASWEPLTHLSFLRDLIIKGDLAHPPGWPRGGGPFPTVDLDTFPAMQCFSAKICAGVKGHVRGAYIETGHVKSINLSDGHQAHLAFL